MTLSPTDRLEINDLAVRYAAYVDARRIDDLVALFTEDGVLVAASPPADLGPTHVHRGPRAIADAMGALTQVPVTLHALVGHLVEPTGSPDAATGSVACIAHHLTSRRDGRVRNAVWHLRYADRYARVPGGWLIERREMHVDWIETREVEQWRD